MRDCSSEAAIETNGVIANATTKSDLATNEFMERGKEVTSQMGRAD